MATRDKSKGGTALVTGAGRGMGREYARQLAAMGYELLLAGRSDNVLAVRDSLRAGGYSAEAIIIDLARAGAAEALYDRVTELGARLDLLVNNAGMFSYLDILDTPASRIEDMLILHDMTLTKLCRLFAADMAARGGGYILNMSSYSQWMPFAGIALYSASKSYVKTFSVAFSKEVEDRGVHVTTVCPAGVATDLYGLSPEFQKLGIRLGVLMTPQRCVRRCLKALWRHRRWTIPDWWNAPLVPLLTHLPGWAERMIRRRTAKYQK